MKEKTNYVEPSDYFPEEILKDIFGDEEDKQREKDNQDFRDYVNNKK